MRTDESSQVNGCQSLSTKAWWKRPAFRHPIASSLPKMDAFKSFKSLVSRDPQVKGAKEESSVRNQRTSIFRPRVPKKHCKHGVEVTTSAVALGSFGFEETSLGYHV